MRVTHFGHSCVLLEIDGTRVLFDPGNLSSGYESLTGLDAILITHQHPDHADPAKLPALVAANPDALRYADPQTAAQLADRGDAGDWAVMGPGEKTVIGAIVVRGTGGRHAVIHPELPVVDNISYVVDTAERAGAFMHPGDSLYIPFERIDVLALPAAAPWLKLSEPIDYLRAVAPRLAFPIHQAIQSEPGRAIHNARIDDMRPAGTEFTVLEPGLPAEL
ncbi:MBL fold metallo-hydrolase [Gordonia neofelifaecis]|uniref:Beta-lactamase domain-containing protein n=1 Tax=Gordonia neofelifaecis NRRL B-59395 TaxID=644548 RepID=F1YJ61_9ACTN|nr:MBL fold metallo-hydrolase [Gordonia neofelifaecis]EGD55276.1 beta-lactamase domain-containing protein [Gordonia neofelifaecis NRRL B-59395]